MKKRVLSLLLTLVLLLGLSPASAQAKKLTDDPVNDKPYVFTDKDDAVLDNDVFARIDAVTDSIHKPGAVPTEQDYIDKLPEVIEAIKTSDTYKDGTLMKNGEFLVWETTVGMPCCFSPYMEAKLNGCTVEEDVPALSYEEKAANELQAAANYPSSTKLALILPYWKSDTDYHDQNFGLYHKEYYEQWEELCEATGSSKTKYRFTMNDATIDHVAEAIEECALVMIDSHGVTDYQSGKDKTSKANCSYICLKTSDGVTSEDTKKRGGTFGNYYYVLKAKNFTAVSGSAITNHMEKDAPHSFVYLGICLGMATDGLCRPLMKKGVEAVWGYSQSVTFDYNGKCMGDIMTALEEGNALSGAVSKAKEIRGNWDSDVGTISEARNKRAAFPILTSSEDPYPGQGNVDALQDVHSSWCLYQPGGRSFLVASDIQDLELTANPALPGYYIRIYAKVNGKDANLPTDKLSVYWESSTDAVSWKKVANSDDQPYIIASTDMIGTWFRAKVFPKNQDDHLFTLVTTPTQVVAKLERLLTPVIPEITRGGSSPASSVYLNPRLGQEYLILTSTAEPTESDWQNAWSYSSTYTTEVTNLATWNSMNYVWTRYYETDTYFAGEMKRCTKFYYGSSTTSELKGTEMSITFVRNPYTGDHAEGYWAGDVLKIDLLPIPSGVSFDGFAGSTWYYPFFNDEDYGSFYADIECRYQLNADTKYRTVYLKIKKPVAEAYITCGPSATGCYTIIDVANTEGHYPVKKVTVPTYSIQIGEVTTRLPFSFTPEKSSYNVENLYVVRDTNVQENGPEGTEPTVIFHANGTMDVDTTPCIEAPYSFRIIEPETESVVGKMRVWVGDFDAVPLESLSFEESQVDCYAGRFKWIKLRSTPANGMDLVSFESNKPSIATVKGPGQITGGYCDVCVSVSSEAKSGDVVRITARAGNFTATCKVTVKEPPKIQTQPKNVTVKEGETATFTVKATGDDLSYQWYYREPGSTGYTPVSAASGKTASYTLTAQARHNGYQYCCWINGGMQITQDVTLTVQSPPVITAQPDDTTVIVGSKAAFTVEATGNDLSYQWYYRKSSSDSWTKVSASSGKTKSYSLTAEARHDRYQYRCNITNALGTAKTVTVMLKVKPKITTQPKDVSVVLGKKASFTVAAEGGETYQWYYRTSEGGDWTKVSAASGTTASYSLTTAARHNGYQYRCRVTNKVTYTYSKTVTLKVKPKITTQPKDVTVAVGKTATFKVAAENATEYQWYYSKDGGATWTAVNQNGASATYKLTTAARHNGYQYKCKVFNATSYVWSKVAALTLK